MNEEKYVVLKGTMLNKKEVLNNPGKYMDSPMFCFQFPKEYVPAVKSYIQDIDGKAGPMELTIKLWPETPSDRAKHFFFLVRDRVATATFDESREHKDHLYRSCIEEFRFMEKGRVKNSIKQLSLRELWLVTEHMFEWAHAAGCKTMGDLEKEWKDFSKELKDEIKGKTNIDEGSTFGDLFIGGGVS